MNEKFSYKLLDITDCTFEDDDLFHIKADDKLYLYKPFNIEILILNSGTMPKKLVVFELGDFKTWDIYDWGEK